MDLAEAYFTAEEALLLGSIDLQTALGGLLMFTAVPENQQPNYLVYGEHQVLEEEDECADEGFVFTTVSWWVKTEPPATGDTLARTIGGLVKGLLMSEFALDGHVIDLSAIEDHTYVTDPDGSCHGRLVIRHETTESAA